LSAVHWAPCPRPERQSRAAAVACEADLSAISQPQQHVAMTGERRAPAHQIFAAQFVNVVDQSALDEMALVFPDRFGALLGAGVGSKLERVCPLWRAAAASALDQGLNRASCELRSGWTTQLLTCPAGSGTKSPAARSYARPDWRHAKIAALRGCGVRAIPCHGAQQTTGVDV
jgi:hypothetical protein